MKKRLVIGAIACAVGVLPLSVDAQSFNVDVNGIDFGVPSDGYGAAPGQAGTWNTVDASGIPVVLDGLDGIPTGVSILISDGALFSFDNAGTAGDDQALMDDVFDLGGVGGGTNVLFSGLAEGTYGVFTYAWAPVSDTLLTEVDVLGGTGPQLVGGAWPGGFGLGTTHAADVVAVGAGGELSIDLATFDGFGSLNGVQLVLPEPAGLSMLVFGVAAWACRRRR